MQKKKIDFFDYARCISPLKYALSLSNLFVLSKQLIINIQQKNSADVSPHIVFRVIPYYI